MKFSNNILKYCLPVLLFIIIFAASADPTDILKHILPSESDFSKIKSVGDSQKAIGKELYKLINGGAVTFFKYDFKQAIFQEYTLTDGQTVNLEIYEMASSKGSEGIYLEKKGDTGQKLNFGENGILSDYYCMLQQGPYYVTVTGGDATEDVRRNITAMARIVIDNIKEVVAVP